MIFESSDSTNTCCWIQFLHASAVAAWRVDGEWESELLTGPLPGNSGTIELTTSTDDLHWLLDTMNPSGPDMLTPDQRRSPCYDPAGGHIRLDESILITDKPGGFLEAGLRDQAVEEYPQAEAVILHARFEAYLVCDREVCARVRWTARWEWTSSGGYSNGVYTLNGIDTADVEISDAQWDEMASRYPHQTDVQR